MNNKTIFDAYVYVCSECGCLYGCNVPSEKNDRIRKECAKCDEKYRCVYRLVYKFSSNDNNIKPEWSGQNQEGIIFKSDGYCSEECVILRNSMTYSDEEIKTLLKNNNCSAEDIEEIGILLKTLRRLSRNVLIREETNRYLFDIFKKILKIEERVRQNCEGF